jgi:hypothetical protein
MVAKLKIIFNRIGGELLIFNRQIYLVKFFL